MTVFYNRIGSGLGDLWAVVNFLLVESERIGEPVKLHHMSGDFDLTDMVMRICALLASTGRVELTTNRPTRDVPQNETWMSNRPYSHTKIPWTGGGGRTICYQIDGRSQADLKNMSMTDLKKIIASFPSHVFVPVGLPLSMERTAELLSEAVLFLGVCSGVSHIAHSARVPTFLVEYRFPISNWHGSNAYVRCDGTDDAIARLREKLK